MNNITIPYKYRGLFLFFVVLFFVFKIGVSSSKDLIVNSIATISNGVSHSLGSIDENEKVSSFDVDIKEMKKLNVSSFLLMDFDDSEFSFSTVLNSLTIVCFFQDVILKYNSFVYKNVKLFLFYSSIKIPSVFL